MRNHLTVLGFNNQRDHCIFLSGSWALKDWSTDGRCYQSTFKGSHKTFVSIFRRKSVLRRKFSPKLWQMFHKLCPQAPGDSIFPDFLTLSEKIHLLEEDCNNSRCGASIFIGSWGSIALYVLGDAGSGWIDRVTDRDSPFSSEHSHVSEATRNLGS